MKVGVKDEKRQRVIERVVEGVESWDDPARNPFKLANPNRQGFVGRDLMFQLLFQITLHPQKCQSERALLAAFHSRAGISHVFSLHLRDLRLITRHHFVRLAHLLHTLTHQLAQALHLASRQLEATGLCHSGYLRADSSIGLPCLSAYVTVRTKKHSLTKC